MRDAILTDIRAEVARAKVKFTRWPSDPIHAAAIIAEECGEIQKAVLEAVYEPHKGSRKNIRKEAIQAAAMCVRFIESLDVYEWYLSKMHIQKEPTP